MTSASKEVPPSALGTISHPSGALKIPGTPDFPELHIWFPDCQSCRQGIIFYSYHWPAPGGEWRQCLRCYNRYFQWFQQRKLIRYTIARANYPIKLRTDHSKTLEKSAGRIFYHEIEYTKECERTFVEAYALDAHGQTQEQLRIQGALRKSFPTLAAAQVWIEQQMGGSLRTFWFS
jgi:hypothetical protein